MRRRSALARTLKDLHQVDVNVYEAIANSSTPQFDTFMRRLSNAANYSRLSIASAGLLAATGGEQGRRAARLGLASVAVTAAITNVVVKPLARRPRPDRAARRFSARRHIRMPRTQSFPSGHSAAAFAFATGVGQALPAAGAAMRVLATLVAYSRIHTGVHYPSDTVVGALLGTVLAQGTTWALERPRQEAAWRQEHLV